MSCAWPWWREASRGCAGWLGSRVRWARTASGAVCACLRRVVLDVGRAQQWPAVVRRVRRRHGRGSRSQPSPRGVPVQARTARRLRGMTSSRTWWRCLPRRPRTCEHAPSPSQASQAPLPRRHRCVRAVAPGTRLWLSGRVGPGLTGGRRYHHHANLAPLSHAVPPPPPLGSHSRRPTHPLRVWTAPA